MKIFKPESGLKRIKFGFLLTTEVNSGDGVEDVCFHPFFYIKLKI